MKNYALMFLLVISSIWLSAQITREQADKIIWEHIQNEATPPYLLYVHNDAPSAEGLMITTYHEETVKVKYACWAYYLNENPGVSEPTQHRYLFVKEDDGNLLEIITSNDLSPDLTGWEPVLGLVNAKKEFISIYPNPTTGELNIIQGIAGLLNLIQYRNDVRNIEIFDVYGRALQFSTSHKSPMSPETTINISHLPTGIYFIKITTEAETTTKKIIKL